MNGGLFGTYHAALPPKPCERTEMPIQFDNRAQHFATSRGLQQLPQEALQKLDQDRNGTLSLEEIAQKSAAAGLDGDGRLDAQERNRLGQLLGVPLTTLPSTSPTAPTRPPSPSASPLRDFLAQNPDIETNQDLINTAYSRSGNNFASAARFIEALGLKMSDLTKDRHAPLLAPSPTETRPSNTTPSPTSTRPSSSTNTPSPTPTRPSSSTNTPSPTPTRPSSSTNTPSPTSTERVPPASSRPTVGLRVSDELLARHDRYDREKLQEWEGMVNTNLTRPTSEKLHLANAFFNTRLVYASDQQAWNRSDYWASPVESLAKGGGDCDDFAISKYVTLRKMGIPAQDLKLAYVYLMEPGKARQAHMVLLHQPPGETGRILDNFERGIKTIAERSDLIPVFTFNETGLWASQGQNWSARVSGTSEQLSKWQDTLGRMRNEGIW